MGWRTWERFQCNTDCKYYPKDCISENLVKSTASAMEAHAFKTAGYQYLVLDDCWMNRTRDQDGKLIPDPGRFPSGFKNLADYVHSKGLKVGVRLSTGKTTCNGFPGSDGHLQTDAQTLADWGVDWVTLDGCNTDQVETLNSAYPDFGHYLNQTGRHMVYECYWPMYLKQKGMHIDWGKISSTCNLWRMYDKDLIDSWESLKDNTKFFGDNLRDLVNYTGPGAWNNPDQLVVGDYGLSHNQERMQMAIWAVTSAPLMVSADLRTVDQGAADILLNKLAIAINQDPLGVMGTQVMVHGQVYIWRKPIMPRGSFAIALKYTNIAGGPTKITIKLQDLGLTTAAAYKFTDVFTGKDLGTVKPWYTYNCEVNPTGVLFIHAQALP